MTKPEITGKRSLGFSQWSRTHLRDSKTGLVWTDIDGFFEDYKSKRIMLVECKTKNAHTSWSQNQSLRKLDMIVRQGAQLSGYEYWGLTIITMDGDDPDDSTWIKLNGCPIGKEALINHLNFSQRFNPPKLL